MDLSVIIVNWNTRELLRKCLQSVDLHGSTRAMEVIVVDNNSADTSQDMVRSEFPYVRLICNTQNYGFARANNQGIAQSRGKYILLLNSDTEVKPQALDCLVDFLEAHPDCGAAGSLLLNPDGSLQTSCYPFPTAPRELWRLFHMDNIRAYGVYHMENWDRQTSREVDHIKGASILLRRAALDQVGLLDEDYFMYSEELDLCFRLRKAGWWLYWVPKSVVVHYGGQSTKQASAVMFLELYRSKVQYFRKNLPRQTALYKITLFAASLIRVCLAPFALLENSARRTTHLTTARFYWRLLQALPRI